MTIMPIGVSVGVEVDVELMMDHQILRKFLENVWFDVRVVVVVDVEYAIEV